MSEEIKNTEITEEALPEKVEVVGVNFRRKVIYFT